MSKKLFFLFLLFLAPACCQADFSHYFSDQTMRIDYYHTGERNREFFSLDQVYIQGIWAGSKKNLIDTLNLGKYQVKVFDAATDKLIYSRGFSSLYGEWETTPAAKQDLGTFQETALIPCPKQPIKLVIAKRGKNGAFKDLWLGTGIDPNSRFVNRERMAKPAKVIDLAIHGPCSTKVDLLILGDGYQKSESKKFRQQVKYFRELFLKKTPPFNRRAQDFNIRALEIPSVDRGIDEPRENRWKNTPLGCSFNSFDLDRYVLSMANKDLRDWAACAPYDQLIIIFNSTRYGGGGIFNLYAISFAGNLQAPDAWLFDYVVIHEFGHAFGGLADEYYTSSVAYEDFYSPAVEPWEPNITAQTDPNQLKWRALVTPGTALPTPWKKTAFDSLTNQRYMLNPMVADYPAKAAALNAQIQTLLHDPQMQGVVGAFEGAGYLSQGLFRPALDCRMFSKSQADFDPVCQKAIERMIDFYTR
ncbi:IgA Peptidase M64 [candidate division KSB1 bacterium]|nr:IgA Peptidase M64 [candidate division KSB1 bacterium]